MQDLPTYTYRAFRDEASGEYVAGCQEIRGLSGIGETASEAVAELQEALAGWLEVLLGQGMSLPLPEPLSTSAAALRKTA